MFGWLEEKKQVLSFFSNGKDPLFSISTEKFDEYYKNNAIVFSAINLIKNNSLGFSFLINNKNISIPINSILHHLMISGNCFLTYEDCKFKLLNLHNITIMLNKEQDEVIYFENKISKKKYLSGEVLFLKIKESCHDICGVSPIKAIQMSIETHNYIMKYLFKTMKNGGRASGIFSNKNVINPNQYEKLKNEISNTYDQITNNTFSENIGIVKGEFSWQKIGADPKELQALEIKQNLEKDICYALNIPPILIGVVDSKITGYAEAKQQFNEYMENYIIFIINEINEFFNLNIQIEHNKIMRKNE